MNNWWKQLGLRAGLYVGAVLVLGFTVSHHLPWVWIALAAATVGGMGILLHLKLAGLEQTTLNAGRKAAILLAVVEVGIVLCFIKHLDFFSRWGFIGITLAAFGFGQLAAEIFASTYTDNEHAFINGFATQLDRVIREEAARAGIGYLAEMENVLADNTARICDTPHARNAGVNYLALNPVGGKIDPTGWLHNSMHPNSTGHRLMAAVATRWMQRPRPAAERTEEVPARKSALPDVLKEVTPRNATVEDACKRAAPDPDCKLADAAWIHKQTRHAIIGHLPALVLLFGGAEALWFCVLRTRRASKDGTVQPSHTSVHLTLSAA